MFLKLKHIIVIVILLALGCVLYFLLDNRSTQLIHAQSTSPNIKLTKTASPSFVRRGAGDIITYTIGYENNSLSQAKNVIIRDQIPEGVSFIQGSSQPGGAYANQTITWDLGDVFPQAGGKLKFKVMFGDDQPDDSTIVLDTRYLSESDGSYVNPYVIDSATMIWHINAADLGAGVRYETVVHMDYPRSCATVFKSGDLNFDKINGQLFSYTADMAGWYYLRLNIDEGNGYYEEARVHLYCRVPPLNLYTHPYNYPENNWPPHAAVEITNRASGSGTWTDPIRLKDPSIVRFRVDGASDPDAANDLRKGVLLWGIITPGNHPVYARGQNIRHAADTYLYHSSYDSDHYWNGIEFEWDTNERPANNCRYQIRSILIDQHGAKSDFAQKHFYVDRDDCQ